jgi:hypothetical protein
VWSPFRLDEEACNRRYRRFLFRLSVKMVSQEGAFFRVRPKVSSLIRSKKYRIAGM